MDYSEWMKWLIPLLSALMAGGGLWTLLAARATSRATTAAAVTAAESANRQASTADWTALMSYWQSEMSAMRDTAGKLDIRIQFLELQREEDQAHIDALEQHIWKALPPPPPPRIFRKSNQNPAL